jgi:hypothetical protein
MTFLLFLTFYGAISAQYLLWVVPLAALWPERWMIAHGVACTVALAGFYFFLAPGVLAPEALALARPVGGWLWAIGTAAALAIGVGWLISLIAGERRPESEAVARAV